MLKYFVALAILLGVGYALYTYATPALHKPPRDYKNATYEIQGHKVTLVNGESIVDAGGGSKTETKFFGNIAKGDVNDDGIPDVAFLVTQNGGGSGTFVYAVAALQDAEGNYSGTNGILLGDRIAPQTTEIRNGILIVNYADRKPDEPFSTPPSVGVSTYMYFDGEKLTAASSTE